MYVKKESNTVCLYVPLCVFNTGVFTIWGTDGILKKLQMTKPKERRLCGVVKYEWYCFSQNHNCEGKLCYWITV